MRIEEIRLRNVRSHVDTRITLREGINLLHGDVGSGKSSILYAIEFVLFGTGSRFGKNGIKLLRSGERKGAVEIKMNVDGREYIFHRELTGRGDKGGYVVEDGVKYIYPASEMRQKALSVLRLREPKSVRSRSYIYEYAIFTPQEEMKKVLEESSENRMKLLRKAFGLVDYASARDNAVFIARKFKNERDNLRIFTETLVEKQREFSRIERTISDLKGNEKGIIVDLEVCMGKEEKLKIERENKEMGEISLRNAEMALLSATNRRANRSSDMERLKREVKKIEMEREKVKSLRNDHDRYNELEGLLDGLRKNFNLRQLMESGIKNLERERSALFGEISSKRKEVSRAEILENEIRGIETELSGLKGIRNERERSIMEIASMKKDMTDLKVRIEGLDGEIRSYGELEGCAVCPKCGQELSRAHLASLLSKVGDERGAAIANEKATRERLSSLQGDLNRFDGEVKNFEHLGRKLVEKNKELEHLASLRKEVDAKEGEMEILGEELMNKKKSIEDLVIGDLGGLERERESLKRHYEEYLAIIPELEREDRARKDLESEKREVEELEHREKSLEEKVRSLKGVGEELRVIRASEKELVGEISKFKERLKNIGSSVDEKDKILQGLDLEIKKLERKLDRFGRLEKAISYLEEFINNMEIIERNVVNFLNAEFEKMFQECFSLLLEGGEISVSVDEGFTPLIKANGMDINMSSLSGGERTSVAMAYRLALNKTVQRESTGMKENMIILDEPTDGFSGEQIDRFRELLAGMGCNQIILVSHEPELLSFADHVFRIEKSDGASRMVSPG